MDNGGVWCLSTNTHNLLLDYQVDNKDIRFANNYKILGQIENQEAKLLCRHSGECQVFSGLCRAFELERVQGRIQSARADIGWLLQAFEALDCAAPVVATRMVQQCSPGNQSSIAYAVSQRCTKMASLVWEIDLLARAEDMSPRSLIDHYKQGSLNFQQYSWNCLYMYVYRWSLCAPIVLKYIFCSMDGFVCLFFGV